MAAVLYLKVVLELATVPYVYASFSTPSEVDCSRFCILNETCYRYWSSVSRERFLRSGNTAISTTTTTITTTAPTTTATLKTTTTTTTTTTAPTTTSTPKTTTTTKVGTSHGMVCERKQDCRIKKSVCYGGVCLCRIGLYFSPKRNACLRACDKYGDEMDVYKGASIVGCNDKTLNETTLITCLNLCVREKAFTCKTCEWRSDRQCFLSVTGYLDVPFYKRLPGFEDYCFGQRQCK